MNNDFLQHFGILGMKWGKRKVSSLTTTNYSEDHNKKKYLKTKKISELSNAELKALNERLQLERSYKDLRKQDVSAGRKFMTDILLDIGKETVKDLLKSSLKSSLNSKNKKNKK